MTVQQRMKAALESLDIPKKEIEVYGSQIVVTAWSESAVKQWASVLARFATFRGIVHTIDYAKENKGTCLMPSVVQVWRAYARIS